MRGLAINSRENIFGSIPIASWNQKQWLIESECTPYLQPDFLNYEPEEWEIFLKERHFETPESSGSLIIKPNFFQDLAQLVIPSDFLYLLGKNCENPTQVDPKLLEKSKCNKDRTSPESFELISDLNAIFIIFSGSWWEIYNLQKEEEANILSSHESSKIVTVESNRWEKWRDSNYRANIAPFDL